MTIMSDRFQAGDLVQIGRGITGQGDVGIVIGPSVAYFSSGNVAVLDILFSDGIRAVHPGNLQKPDGRTKQRRVA